MDHMGLNQVQMAEALGYPREMINRVYNGKQDVSKNLLKKVTEIYTSLSADWMLHGTGEMLKFSFFDEWKLPTEDEEKELYLLKNIPALLSALGLSAADLALRVGIPEHIYITPGNGEGSYPIICLVRLARFFQVSTDALLFLDLTNPEIMQQVLQARDLGKQVVVTISPPVATTEPPKEEVEKLKAELQRQGEILEQVVAALNALKK